MSETYQKLPSGSTTTWWGLAVAENPSACRSTVATTLSRRVSITDTVADD